MKNREAEREALLKVKGLGPVKTDLILAYLYGGGGGIKERIASVWGVNDDIAQRAAEALKKLERNEHA